MKIQEHIFPHNFVARQYSNYPQIVKKINQNSVSSERCRKKYKKKRGKEMPFHLNTSSCLFRWLSRFFLEIWAEAQHLGFDSVRVAGFQDYRRQPAIPIPTCGLLHGMAHLLWSLGSPFIGRLFCNSSFKQRVVMNVDPQGKGLCFLICLTIFLFFKTM